MQGREAMNKGPKLTSVSVNGRTGVAMGVGMGPNVGMRYVLWDGTDSADWVPNGDVRETRSVDVTF